MEIWKEIAEFGGQYFVSNLGRVMSKGNDKSRKDKIMKGQTDNKGYQKVLLVLDGKPVSRKIHRLVATEFIPNPDDKATVNHKNFNKKDNRVENLEWMSNVENLQHSRINRAYPKRWAQLIDTFVAKHGITRAELKELL